MWGFSGIQLGHGLNKLNQLLLGFSGIKLGHGLNKLKQLIWGVFLELNLAMV
jgi:hypothetical protein